jgi:hypothetical protein
MKLTWHLIWSDLRHFRWSIALWLGCLAFVFLGQERIPSVVAGVEMRDYVRLVTLLLLVGLAVAVLMGVIQADPADDSHAFWRTRPIAPARLIAAKLALLLGLFVGVPFLLVLGGGWLQRLVLLGSWSERLLMLLVLGTAALAIMAAASCTRTIGHGVVLLVGLVFASGTLADFVSSHLPRLNLKLSLQTNLSRVITLLAASALVSVAIILNQYLRRNRRWSIVLLAGGAVLPALLGAFWTYYYFYHG